MQKLCRKIRLWVAWRPSEKRSNGSSVPILDLLNAKNGHPVGLNLLASFLKEGIGEKGLESAYYSPT